MKKLTIIGSSVALRVRPTSADARTYGELLQEKLATADDGPWLVRSCSASRLLSSEMAGLSDSYIATFPNYYVLNVGVADAPPRPVGRRYADVVFGRRYPDLRRVAVAGYERLHRSDRLRHAGLALNRHRPWVNIEAFESNLDAMLTTLRRETRASMIVVGINRGSVEQDRVLPGANAAYTRYNAVLATVSERQNAHFVDVRDLTPEDHFPDGVHYNAEGHRSVAERITAIVTANE